MNTNDIHLCARMDMIKELQDNLKSGADPDGKDRFGTTALQYAIAEKHAEAVAVLLQYGANVAAKDRQGRTALHYAVEHRQTAILKLLLETWPEAVAIEDKHGNQPLWTATHNARGSYELVKLLLDHGADSHHRNRVGLTPIDIAVQDEV